MIMTSTKSRSFLTRMLNGIPFNNMMYCFAIIILLSTKLNRLKDRPRQLISELSKETSIIGDILLYLNEPLLYEAKGLKQFRMKLQSILLTFANNYIR